MKRNSLSMLIIVIMAIFGHVLLIESYVAQASTPEQNRSISDRTLKIPIFSTTAINTLDPILSVEIAQYDLCNQIFEGLVSVDLKGDFAPRLATHWEHTSDYKLWTFYLRDANFADDPVFSDGHGRKIDVEDVLYSFKRGLSPKQGSKGAFALSRSVLGAKEYSEGKIDEVLGLRSPRPGVIEIELTSGDKFFPAALTVPATYVVPREAVIRYGDQFGRNPVGSGPFKLGQWVEGNSLILLRNPAFGKGIGRQPAPSLVNKVEFRFFRSEAQIINAFKAREIDLRPIVGADLATTSGSSWEQELSIAYPSANLVQPGWLLKLHLLAPQIGTGHPFGKEGTVRRALQQLLAKKLDEIDAFRGIGKAQNQLLPANLAGSLKGAAPTVIPDPEQLLKENVAGHEIRIAYASSRLNDTIVHLLEQILSNAGASPLLFPSTSINALFGSLATVKPDLTLIYWSPYFPNVSEFITALLTSSQPVPNFTGFSSKKLDSLAVELNRGNSDTDENYKEIEQILNNELPWLPLYIETPYYLVSKEIVNFSVNPVSVTQLASIRFK